jgi:hypothetical protein
MKKAMVVIVVLVGFVVLAVAGYGQRAAQLEEPYRTCAQHYIPAEKCTIEVWAPLVQAAWIAAGNAPVDSRVVWALLGVQAVQVYLKNPASIQIRNVFVREVSEKSSLADGPIVCFEVSAQNSLGGMDIGWFAFHLSKNRKHPEREKLEVDHWTKGGDRDIAVGFGGALGWMGWNPLCGAVGPGQGGRDITEQVKHELQR